MNRCSRSTYINLVPAISLLFPLLLATNVWGLPCKGQTVNIGETMDEVTAKCGSSVLREQWTEKVEETDEEGAISSTVTTVDEWTYDSGPTEVMQSYRFENGKLREIKNVGYGMLRDFDACRSGEKLAVGDSTVETYLKCGEPLAKEKRDDKVLESESHGKMLRIFIPVVEWTYRYGPDAPGYTVTFENGEAVKIRTREFGK